MVEVIWNLSRNHSLVWVVDGGQERNRTSTGLLPLDFESSASTVPPLALRNYCVVNFQSPISNHWILGIGYYGEAVGYLGTGNLRQRVATSLLTLSNTTLLPGSRTTRLISPANLNISNSFIPRVVTAGTPNRIPEGSNGLRVSPGIIFLLTTIPTFSKAVSASLPVTPIEDKSTKIK